MKITMNSKPILLCNILILLVAIKVTQSTSTEFYDKFRAIFGSVATLQPYDIDQITSQILKQVNCSYYLGVDCYNCLSSSRLQASSLIGTTVSSYEFERVALIMFCYLLDLNQFCYVNSIPDYGRCYNFLTNSTNIISSNNLDNLLKSRILPNYKVSNYFYPNSINSVSNKDNNCIDGKALVRSYASGSNDFVTGVEQLNGLSTQVIFMMYNKMKIGCDLPYTNWFIDRIFSKNNSIVDYINMNDLKNLMTDMGLETFDNQNKVSNTFRLVLFDEENTEKVNHVNINGSNVELVTSIPTTEAIAKLNRRRRNTKTSDSSQYDKCYSVEELKEIHSLSDSISRIDFHTLSPALIYMKLNGGCSRRSSKSIFLNFSAFTKAEKYGYGSTAIVCVSLVALLGIIMVPCFQKKTYEYLLIILTGLAVGTLLSSALLHLLPTILEIHLDDHYSSIPNFAFKVIGAMFVIYIFWLLDIVLKQLSGEKFHINNSNNNQTMFPEQTSTDNLTSKSEANELNAVTSAEPTEYYFSNKSKHITTEGKWALNSLKLVKVAGWIVLFGDALHNFADGIVVGAAFSKSLNLGVSTSVAVFSYRVPKQLGNYTLLINSGFTHLQALIFNILSTSCCLIGFFLSISISTDPQICLWIFTIVTGMFIYISLIDFLPKVVHGNKWSWRRFIISNIAMILGFLIMFLLLIFEEQIRF